MMNNIFYQAVIDGTQVLMTDDFSNINFIKFIYNPTEYVNNVQNLMAYDTETSNGILDGARAIPFNHHLYLTDEKYRKLIDTSEKISCVYLWQFAIEDDNKIWCFYGRTLEDYTDFITKLTGEITRQSNGYFNPHLSPALRKTETEQALKGGKYSRIQPYIHNF